MISWLKRWGWVLVVGLAGIIAFCGTAGRLRFPLRREVAAAKAEEKATKLAARVSHTAAIKEIEKEYETTISRLNRRQQNEASILRKNPGKLAKFLVRVASEGNNK